eukprot:7647957-Pyramimonas_sp.AAC.1
MGGAVVAIAVRFSCWVWFPAMDGVHPIARCPGRSDLCLGATDYGDRTLHEWLALVGYSQGAGAPASPSTVAPSMIIVACAPFGNVPSHIFGNGTGPPI